MFLDNFNFIILRQEVYIGNLVIYENFCFSCLFLMYIKIMFDIFFIKINFYI